MSNVGLAPRTASEFRPYAGARRFLEIYAKTHEGRPVNQFSRETDQPLILGGKEELAALRETGLTGNNLLFQILGTPVYLFERDNMTTYAAAEAIDFGVMSPGATLCHFDAHPDMNRAFEPKDGSLQEVFKSSASSFNEGSFIWNLVRLGYVDRVLWFNSSPGPQFINGSEQPILEAFPRLKITTIGEDQLAGFDRQSLAGLPKEKVILHIDYDYFAHPRLEFGFSLFPFILQLFPLAGVVIQATSPDYIDRRFAARLAANFMTSL